MGRHIMRMDYPRVKDTSRCRARTFGAEGSTTDEDGLALLHEGANALPGVLGRPECGHLAFLHSEPSVEIEVATFVDAPLDRGQGEGRQSAQLPGEFLRRAHELVRIDRLGDETDPLGPISIDHEP